LLSHFIFTEKRIVIRLWLGAVFGLTGLMWSHVPFSFIFEFTIFSHLCGFIFFGLIILCVGLYRKKSESGLNPFRNKKSKTNKLTASDKLLMPFLFVFMILGAILIFNHTLVEIDGGYYTGQATYGDMNFHLGIITSIAEQQTFPPDYNIFPGAPLDYYFLCDSVSSSLYIFGTSLKASYILPMLVGFLATFAGFWLLADKILQDKRKTSLAFIFYFLNGGLGFLFFMNKEKFKDIFTGWYCTPTNYRFKGDGETTIVWTNAIVDMMLPQRATLFGWMVVFAIFYLLYTAVFDKKNNFYLPAGILAGLLPMIQTQSFFATGLIALCWLIYTATRINKISKKSKTIPLTSKQFFVNWFKFGIPAVILAVPQFIIWIFGAVGGESFLNFHFNAYNEAGDFWPWFWIKNVGIVFILLIPAFIMASKKMKIMYSGAILVFAVTELVAFQTLAYDNNKLYFMWYLFSCILVSGWIIDMLDRMKKSQKSLKIFILTIVIFTASFSALLTVAREVVSGTPVEGEFYCCIGIYGSDQVEACNFILENTEADSTFLCATNHNNAISSLTGRNIYCGSGTFLNSHGVDYQGRSALIQEMFIRSNVFEENKESCGIDYVYISSNEKGSYPALDQEYFEKNYPCVYSKNGVSIYDVR